MTSMPAIKYPWRKRDSEEDELKELETELIV